MWNHRRALGAACIGLAVLAAACGSSSKPAASTTATTAAGGAALQGSINVLAASSLTEGFKQLGAEFEGVHPGTKINLSFGASSDLVTQITQGAPADVFASADEANMTKVVT